MSFAAGFASTFFPAIEEEIEGRKERAEKNADLAWTMFTENMTKRQEARAEAERLRRQAETLVEANGGSRDMIPDVYNMLKDEVFDPAGLGEMIRSGRFQPVSTDTASDTGLSTTEALNAYGGPTREAASSLEETSEAGPDFWSGKEDIQAGIFTGESGGDYDALYGFSNRADGMFSNVTPTEMTVGEVLQFTQPEGAYAQWVKSQVGNVATPVGAYQIVGSTLQGAVDAGIVSADEKFDRSTQDKVGRYILDTQGTDAWVGYEGPADPALLSDTNPSYAEPTAEANPEDSQMAGMFNFRGDSGNAYSVDDQTREIFEERVRAAGMDPDEVDFSSTYDDPMGGGEQRYRIAPESVDFEEIFSEATTQEEVNRLVSVYGPNMSEAEIERAERYRESLPAAGESEEPFYRRIGEANSVEDLLALESAIKANPNLSDEEREAQLNTIAERRAEFLKLSSDTAASESDPVVFMPYASNGALAGGSRRTVQRQGDGTYKDLATGQTVDVSGGMLLLTDEVDTVPKLYNKQIEELSGTISSGANAVRSLLGYRELVIQNPAALNRYNRFASSLIREAEQAEAAFRSMVEEGRYSIGFENAILDSMTDLTQKDREIAQAQLRAAYSIAQIRGSSGQALSDRELQQNLEALGQGVGQPDKVVGLINSELSDLIPRIESKRSTQFGSFFVTDGMRDSMSTLPFAQSFDTYLSSQLQEDNKVALQEALSGKTDYDYSQNTNGNDVDRPAQRQQPAGTGQGSQGKAVKGRVFVTEDMVDEVPSLKGYEGKEVTIYEDNTIEVVE